MELPAEEAEGIVCLCNSVKYLVRHTDGFLRMQSLPGFDALEETVEILLRDILAVELVQKPAGPRGVFSRLDIFSRGAADYATTTTQLISLRIARRVGAQKRRVQTVVLQPEIPEAGEKLYGEIKEYLHGLESRPRRLMFFLNPVSGSGQAVRIFVKNLEPLIKKCEISYEFVVTENAGHAREWIDKNYADVQRFDGLVAVGGDGIFNEVLEGIIRCSQNEDITISTNLKSPAIRIGIIPAGSTDSIGCCIGLGDATTALIHILLGDHMKLDVGAVFRVADGMLLKFFCAFLGYGFFSDTLRNSEKRWLRRFLGKNRYMIAGAKTFLQNRAYDGYISYRAAEGNPEGYPDEGEPCIKDCQTCLEVGGNRTDLLPGYLSEKSQNHEDWQVLDGKFTNVIAVNMCCRSHMSPKGIAPVSHCSDGCLDLLVVRSINRLRLLNYLISTSRGVGPQRLLGHFLHACRAYELVFLSRKPGSEGDNVLPTSPTTVWNCDGEIVAEPDIHVKICYQLIDIFGAGLEPS